MIFSENIIRKDIGPAKYSESIYAYYNRSARHDVENIREIIETWYKEYPLLNKIKLSKGLRSMNNREFYSNFFELFVYNYLKSILTIRPLDSNGSKETKYDFDAKFNGDSICIEATVSYDSDNYNIKKQRRNKIIDYINRNVKDDKYYLYFSIKKEGVNEPRLKHLVKEIKIFIIDSGDGIKTIDEEGSFLEYQKNTIAIEDWIFEVSLIPRKDKESNNVRAIGIGPMEFVWSRDVESLKNSIQYKAKHYKNIKDQYLLVINNMNNFGTDDEDVISCLFGKEELSINIETGETSTSRKRDGVWVGPKGPRNLILAGILFFNKLTPWNIENNQPTLYVNPWANLKNDMSWWKWRRLQVDEKTGKYEFINTEKYPKSYFGIMTLR